MPRTRAQNDAIREHRKRKILDSAVELFAQNGFSETKISDIAQHAGMSHGTVYLYYSTKEDLWRDSVVVPLDEVVDEFIQILTSDSKPIDRIRTMVDAQIRSLSQQQTFLRLVHMVLGQRERFSELVQEIYQFTERYFTAIQPVILEAQSAGDLLPGDPWTVAWSYFCYLNGVGLTTEWPQDSPLWTAMVENGMRIFGCTTGHEPQTNAMSSNWKKENKNS